jgi:hypothetical protein
MDHVRNSHGYFHVGDDWMFVSLEKPTVVQLKSGRKVSTRYLHLHKHDDAKWDITADVDNGLLVVQDSITSQFKALQACLSLACN